MAYLDMQVKQLAALSGLKPQTITSYLGSRAKVPSAEAAVRIAQALGVSVEYLVTGKDAATKQNLASLAPETRLLHNIMQNLDVPDRQFLLKVAALVKDREKAGSHKVDIKVPPVPLPGSGL